LWGWKKMINRQLIAFVAPVLLITLLFLSSTMIFDYSVMGKPVWGPDGEKNAHRIFSHERVVG
jgi:hypothetical protein